MFSKKSKWLCAAERFTAAAGRGEEKEALGHDTLCMLARREVKMPKKFESAVLRLSADDHCALYINGAFVCQGPAACYPQEQYVQSIDVTRLLRSGANLIALQVIYDGKDSLSRFSGDGRQGFILELEADGVTILNSNDRFRCLCPTGKSFAREGSVNVEIIDLRSFPADWAQPRYDDASWSKPFVKKNRDYVFAPEPVKPDLSVEFAAVPGKDGVYDLEDEYTGVLIAAARGQDGSSLSFYRADADGAKKELLYKLFLNGSGSAEFTLPQRMRRVRVESEFGAVLESLTARVFRYPEESAALSLKTTDRELLNALKRWKRELLDDDACAFDAQISERDEGSLALARSYLSGDWGHMAMYLKTMALSQYRVKTLLSGRPCARTNENQEASLLFAHWAYVYYTHSGDKQLLEEARQAASGVIRAFATYARRDELLENSEKQCLCRINALYTGALIAWENICAALGVESNVRAQKVIKAFNDTFYDQKTGLYVDAEGADTSSQASNVFPLYFGFAPKTHAPLELLKPRGERQSEYFRLKALAKAGGLNEIYSCLISPDGNAPEAELNLFVEDVLSINPDVIGGGVWVNNLPVDTGDVSVRVSALQRKCVFTKQESFAGLRF